MDTQTRPCHYSNEPVFPADRGALRVVCPRCSRELKVSRHFGDRSLPRYPRHVPPATIVVNDAGSGGEPVAAMLLKTTPAGVRHVQMPSGRVLRFDKLGFHMGDQRSTFSIEAA